VLGKPTRVRLAVPSRNGGVTLERCIGRRRSVRSFRDEALSEHDLGQLLWAAQGVTSSDGMRTVPSAGALYPLELYAMCGNVDALAAGVYRYAAECHELVLVAPGRQREKLAAAAYGQEWIATAPVVICIAAVFARTTLKYGDRGRGYVYIEAGHAAENLMLTAVARGLGTTMVGAFSDDEVKHLVRLTANETPLCLIPVGRP
jgi:SagB-type dehydrogenase family enzyme